MSKTNPINLTKNDKNNFFSPNNELSHGESDFLNFVYFWDSLVRLGIIKAACIRYRCHQSVFIFQLWLLFVSQLISIKGTTSIDGTYGPSESTASLQYSGMVNPRGTWRFNGN